MPYRFLDDAPTSDVGFIASGPTLAECFKAAAAATLEVMLANPESLQPRERHTFHVEGAGADLALLGLLEELIYHKDAHSLFLRISDVQVRKDHQRYIVEATAAGETIDPSRHRLAADVKAVTMHRLGIQQVRDGWEATVVLDI